MQSPSHPQSTTRQKQQQRDQASVSTKPSASPTRHGHTNSSACSYDDTEPLSIGSSFRVASEHQPSHSLHSRSASHGYSRNSHSNGNHTHKGSDRLHASVTNNAAMGDGIINQSMKEDLDNWMKALGLEPGLPVHVVGFFGHCRDLSMYERITPIARTSSCIGSFDDDERVPVYFDGCRETSERLSKEENAGMRNGGWTLGLGDQKTHTSPDMNLDSRIISILAALSTVKRQMLQELDRFMAICWDRIGVPPPDHERNQSENGGSGRGSNPLASIMTPGRCVPALVFIIERVPVVAPWHDNGANETQIVEQLRQHILKKSTDAMQTRLSRQLFVLPSPSSTPFVHVIPHFIGQLDLPETLLELSEETLDPAAAVIRQRMRMAAGSSPSMKKQKMNAKLHISNLNREKSTSQSMIEDDGRSQGTLALREIYNAVVQARDRPLSGNTGVGSQSRAENSSELSLGGLYLDYSGPLLRQFVDGWVKTVTSPGGYGSMIGRRHIGTVEVPSSQQWFAGYLGVCEALGITSVNSPEIHAKTTQKKISQNQDDSSTDESLSTKLQNVAINGSLNGNESGGTGGEAVREKVPRRGGKKYSLRCAHLVQKKIQDFIHTDEVMEELYGQKPDMTVTRTHSERYHQLKADQATKLFNSLAYRR
ncbi:hypothetical protein FBU30_008847 [Linnemannia zychae]|nr:hypothetical protein FBU30_008847 [Linnemannia zychae]